MRIYLASYFSEKTQTLFTHYLRLSTCKKKKTTWEIAYLGEEIPNKPLPENLIELDLFASELPEGVNRDEILQFILSYGIGTCFEKEFLPPLRPVIFLLGADRFNKYFKNPNLELEHILLRAGAGVVIIDRTEI
ncbi:MAG: hypothetical protein HYZ25_08990 [Chloroflexi bacterium]|nr:hypothetical protein [Chloroflexota bacterium]